MPLNTRRGLAVLFTLSILPAIALPAIEGQRRGTGGVLDEPVTAIPRKELTDTPRIELGRALFTSKLLSRGNLRSCSGCHDLETNGAQATKISTSPTGEPLVFNTPTVFNSVLSFRHDWDGKVRTLTQQASQALLNPNFMAETWDDLLPKLQNDAELNARFFHVYGRPADAGSVVDAIAAFEASLLTPDSRFDQWLGGNATALTPQEINGYRLFKSVGCVSCHQGVNVGGNLFQRTGIFQPLLDRPTRRMRVPSLRNVAVTAPYFDDGSAPTLQDAVERMAEAQLGRQLTAAQIDSIKAFLETLTGRYQGRPLRAAR